jgi:SAM-dependent methyltransferase
MTSHLTDRTALGRNRHRARRDPALFLHEAAAADIQDRLTLVNRSFTDVGIVTGLPDFWGKRFPHARCADDTDHLEFGENCFDLVVHAMCLHWANDPVGQLIQCRRALRPDGLFLGVFFGGETLHELRSALAQAEADITGGLSQRVAPMGEIRDLGALLQRAGFALPVADTTLLTASYDGALALMRDLRAMGEGNALSGRPRTLMRRDVLAKACTVYADHFSGPDNRVQATFELITLTGWAPDESQPQPLRPGSATARLADALGTKETAVKD